jgi:O-antigen/teichoic acid export membrane protein
MNQAWTAILPAFLRKRLDGRDHLQSVIANIGWLFGDKILRMGVGLLVGVWMARYLGPEQFGLFSYAGSFVALFSTAATLGLDGIVVRNLVREPECKDKILGTTFILKLFGGGIALTLTVAAIFVLRPADELTRWLVAVTAIGTIFQAFDTIDLWFQAQVESRYTVYAKNAAFILVSAAKVLFILFQAPLVAFAWAGTAEIAIGAAGLVLAYRTSGGLISAWKKSRELGLELLHDSWPLIFSSIFITIYMRIDQVMIGEMVGSGEVGVYSAAVRLAEVWYFIPMAVVSSTFPSIVAARHESGELFYSRLQKLYNLMALLAYLVAVPVTFLAGPIVEFLFGAAYSKAGPMLALLIWAGLFANLGVARSSFLTAMNWARIHVVTVFAGCLINVALNIVLIPRYGGMGAVIASCVAYWFAAHGACFFYRPLFRTAIMLTRAILYPKAW